MKLAEKKLSMNKYCVYDPTAIPSALFNELAYFICSNVPEDAFTQALVGALIYASRKCLVDERQYLTPADRTPEQLSLVKTACAVITAYVAEPGYVFSSLPTFPQYFGFIKETPNETAPLTTQEN